MFAGSVRIVVLNAICLCCYFVFFFFFKQKTAYEILTCDWSSDVCSSDLLIAFHVMYGVIFLTVVEKAGEM